MNGLCVIILWKNASQLCHPCTLVQKALAHIHVAQSWTNDRLMRSCDWSNMFLTYLFGKAIPMSIDVFLLCLRKEPKVNFGERMKTAALKVATWISHTTDLDMHAMLNLAGEVRTAEQLAESRGGRQHISHIMWWWSDAARSCVEHNCRSGTRYDFHAGALHHCKEQLEGHGWSGQIWS